LVSRRCHTISTIHPLAPTSQILFIYITLIDVITSLIMIRNKAYPSKLPDAVSMCCRIDPLPISLCSLTRTVSETIPVGNEFVFARSIQNRAFTNKM
jgi:hypothetical protein